MAIVNVKGTFLSASIKKQTFEGQDKFSIQLDVYQSDSPQTDKTVLVKVDDISLLQSFQDGFKMGDSIELECSLSAYKNQTYFKYMNLLTKPVGKSA